MNVITKNVARSIDNSLIYITLAVNLLLHMMTTKITVPEHIREYLIGKFCNFQETPVRFPDSLDIYHVIYDLLEKRPATHPIDRGNLEILLPVRSIGKNPETYNYLGVRSQTLIVRQLEIMMWAEMHEFAGEQKHRYGVTFIISIHNFINKYGITSLSEDAFLKNYYRWRAKVRSKEKRSYKRKSA